MAINRTTANFKAREDLIDSITPMAQIANDTDRGVGDWRPAAWLPIQFSKSSYQSGTDQFVISAFKPVSIDTQGRLVPSGLRLALGGTGSAAGAFAGVVLTYTALDVTWGVINLVTGLPVAAAVTYTGEALCDALIERGLLRESEIDAIAGIDIPVADDADVAACIDNFISDPIGIAFQDVNVWSGLPEDGDQVFTNYSKQHSIQFITRTQLRVPHRVAGNTTSDAFDADALNTAGTTVFAAGDFIKATEYWNATNLVQLNRYSAIPAAAPVIALGLDERPVAPDTDRTPVACDRTGVLVRQRTSPALVSREGDWYLDADVGVLFLHTDTWATLVALGTANTTFSYSFYTDTGTASAHRYVHFDGPCRPGDWITYDAQSNFTKASETIISAGRALGRVHKIIAEPKGLLESVKTAWNLNGVSSAMKMPGTATKGFSDLITLTSERVADQLVEIAFHA